ncbi:MAG: hypothetical protein C3F02_03525 [Parcubacteria group bacterium]|nr:MAG: hypothetical protein C3F02_03525 [Parcubacteria group bacterium]
MSLLKRLFVFSLVVTTVLTTSALSFNVKAAGSYGAGSLLAKAGVKNAAVYYIGSDGKKYVFPDVKTYNTWYSDFKNVVKVSVTELDMYTDGGAVTYRPGTYLVKTEDTAKVYAVSTGGVLQLIPSEAVAKALYGNDWAKKVRDVIPGYFSSSYKFTGADLSSTLPNGSVVSMGSNRYLIQDGKKRPFASADAFDANNLVATFVLPVTDLSAYADGTSITGEEIAISGFMPVAGGTAEVGGDLTVSLASDTPAAGIVVNNAARYPFTKVNLTTGAKGVTIDTMVIQRGGLAQDADFASVDILDGTTMIPFDANSKTFNSEHKATFTKDLVIPANTTKTIYLSGNMAANLTNYAGEVPALGLASVTLVGGGSVFGTLPVYGNAMTTNATITVGLPIVQRGSYTNATSTTIEVGKKDYVYFSFQIQAGSTEDVQFNTVSVYTEGTAVLGDDVTNIRLYRDGTKIADGVVNGRYADFSGINLTIPKGQTYQFTVKADVAGGSARTIKLEIYRNTDLLVKGLTYGYNITPTYSGTGSAPATTKPVLTDNQFTISNGTLTVERSNTVGSTNITLGNSQTLGAFKFTVKGEPIDVTALTLTVVSTSATTIVDALKSVKFVNSAGATVAGPTDVTAGAFTVAFTDTFTLPIGDTVLNVVGNLDTAGAWATNDTIYVQFNPATVLTATGQVTGNSITASPSSSVAANTQTIKGSYLAVSRQTLPADGNVIPGAQGVLLGSWSFDATNSGEDVRINSLLFAASSSEVTNLTVYDGSTALTPVNDDPCSTRSSCDGVTSTFAFDAPIIVTKGTSKTIQLKGNVSTGAHANNTVQFGLTDATAASNPSVVAYGNTSGNRATLSLTADNGAVLTVQSKATVTVSTYNNPANGLVAAGATGVTMGSVKVDTIYEAANLDQLVVYVADGALTGTAAGTYQDILKVYLYDGSTLLASNAIPSTSNYTFNFNKGTLVVPKDGSKIITIKADFATIDQNSDNAPGTPAADVKLGFGGTDGFKFTGNDSNSTATETYNGSTTSAMILHKSVPTVSWSTSGTTLGADTAMNNGARDIFAFSVAAPSQGEVLLYRATFAIATGGGTDTTVTNCLLKDGNGNVVGASANPTMTAGTGFTYKTFVFDNPNISWGNTKEALQISAGASATYKLNCTIANAGTGDNIAVSLVGDIASSTPAASFGTPAATGQNPADAWAQMEAGNFVWSDNYKNRGLATDAANATAWGQWYNGYLVNGFGTNNTGTAYTIGWAS